MGRAQMIVYYESVRQHRTYEHSIICTIPVKIINQCELR